MAVRAQQVVRLGSWVWYIRGPAINICDGRLGEDSCRMESRVNLPIDSNLQHEGDDKTFVARFRLKRRLLLTFSILQYKQFKSAYQSLKP